MVTTPAFVASRVRGDLTVDERATLEQVRDRLAAAKDRLAGLLADGSGEARASGWARAIDVAAIYRARHAAAAPTAVRVLTEDERTELEIAKAEVGRALNDVRRLLGDGESDSAPEHRSRGPIVSQPYSPKRR
jgi:hypothetical protein